MKIKEIAWLAGIIEGEGFFQLSKEKYPVMSVKMTDEDTISKVAKLWKRPYSTDTSVEKSGWRTQYRVNICGTPAIEWMFTIYSLMSYRRKGQMVELISKWKTTQGVRKDTFRCGHPKVYHNTTSNNGCRTCAMESSKRQYHRNKQLKLKEIANG